MKKYAAWLLVLVLLVTFPTVALGSLFDMTEEEVEASMTQYYKAYHKLGLMEGTDEDAIDEIFPFKDGPTSEEDPNLLTRSVRREDGNFTFLLLKDATGNTTGGAASFNLVNQETAAIDESYGMLLAAFAMLYTSEDEDAALAKGLDMYLSMYEMMTDGEPFKIMDGPYRVLSQKHGDVGFMFYVTPAEDAEDADDATSAPNASGL